MNPTKKSLAKNVAAWIILSLAIIAIVTLLANLYISDKHVENSEQMAEQLEELLVIQSLNNTLNKLVSDFRGYLAFGRQEFYDLSLKERLVFDRKLSEYTYIESLNEYHILELEDNSQSTVIITKLWAEYVELIEQAYVLKQNEDQLLADELSRSRTTPVINEIFAELNVMSIRQQNNVNLIMEENRSINTLLLYLIFGFSFGLASLGFFLIYFLQRSVITPIRTIERHVHSISQGQHIDVPSSGRLDEIGQLEAGINEMSGQLKQRLEAIEMSRVELTEQRDELEAQNEEIIAQQEEQASTLNELRNRELELELITSFQEKLSGHVGLDGFLSISMSKMLEILRHDAILLLVKSKASLGKFHVLYSEGYPNITSETRELDELFGSAIRAIQNGEVYRHSRILTGKEQGLHRAYQHAVDQYYPLFDDQRNVIGLLLLTRYGTDEISLKDQRMARGLIQQFSSALYVQMRSQESVEQRDLVRQIIESINEGILMCDHQGNIILANGRVSTMLDVDIIEGMHTDELIAQLSQRHESTAFNQIINNIHEGLNTSHISNHMRFEYTALNGEALHYDLYSNVITNLQDTQNGYLFVFRDRTQEEKIDEMKNEFVSLVSHELRTPMSSILGFVEILLQREVAPDKQKKYLETVYKEATRLSKLITDFLDIQRMEAGKQEYHFNAIRLKTLIEDLADRYNSASTHEVHLQWHDDPDQFMVSGDYDRLIQVFDNLLSNAVKYSPDQDRVELTMSNEGETIAVDIKDFGLGIPDSARNNLFTKFFRVDNSDRRKIGGTGLGLVIVKEIIEAHHGDISYHSIVGEGSTFTVRLNRLAKGSDKHAKKE